MSGGQKQRLALAGAVIHEPELLFLDEPTSAVDPESRRDFWEKLFDLADAGTTLLVSTHYMDEAERCHRLAILDHGALVADGTPAELTAALAGRTLLVEAAQPRRAQQALVDVPGVLSVAQIGNSLRVLLTRRDAMAMRRAHPRRAARRPGLQAEVAAVAAEPRGRVRLRDRRSPTTSAEQGGRGMNSRRLFAVVVKELRQLRRDRITLAMIVGIPVMQLVLFGYAINLNLRGLDGRRRRPGQHRGFARAGDGHGRDRRDQADARARRTPQELMDAAASRRDQRRRRDPAGLRAPPHRRPRGGAGAGRRQRHRRCRARRCSSRSCRSTPRRPAARASRAHRRRHRSAWSASTTRSGARRSTSCRA